MAQHSNEDRRKITGNRQKIFSPNALIDKRRAAQRALKRAALLPILTRSPEIRCSVLRRRHHQVPAIVDCGLEIRQVSARRATRDVAVQIKTRAVAGAQKRLIRLRLELAT